MKRLIIPIFILMLILTGCFNKDPEEYTVNFNSDGVLVLEEVIVIENELIIEPTDPVKVGYTFIAWYSTELLDNVYDFTEPVTDDITLYVKWEINEYTIEFISNEGTEIVDISVLYNEKAVKPTDPTRNSFTFFNWYTDEALSEAYNFNDKVNSDLVLYAKWHHDFAVDPDEASDIFSLPYSGYMSGMNNPVVSITIEGVGIMTFELFPSVAPNTVNNFIMYIQNGDFSGNSFHRVIEDFMIQGGNTNSTTCPIKGEFLSNGVENDLSHYRGVISMARTSIKDSATSQFFIVHEDSFFLDGEYATFGGLIDGFNVLDYIAGVSTNYLDAPLQPIVIYSITVELHGYEVINPICAN